MAGVPMRPGCTTPKWRPKSWGRTALSVLKDLQGQSPILPGFSIPARSSAMQSSATRSIAGEHIRTADPPVWQRRGLPRRRAVPQTSPSRASPAMWHGTPMPARSAVTASRNAISSTGAAGKARVRAANGTGCASTWKAASSGISLWSIPSWSARPANCATCAVQHRCPSSRRG